MSAVAAMVSDSVPSGALVPARDAVIPTHEQICKAFGDRVRNRRYQLDMSQEKMIKDMNRIIPEGNWGRTSASMWENGNSIPDVPVLWALAHVLGVTPEWLTYGVVVHQGRHRAKMTVPAAGNTRKVTVTGKPRAKIRHIGKGRYIRVTR